jgi:hypothetical protein
MNINAKVVNKLFASEIPTKYKRIIFYEQMGITQECKAG